MKHSPLLCFLFIQIARCFPIARWSHPHNYIRTTERSLAITSEELALQTNNNDVTIRYSHNFRRHIVEKNGAVVQSYFWLDQALQQYPRAKVLPVNPIAMIAGTSVFDNFAYPLQTKPMNVSDNRIEIMDILYEQLNWTSNEARMLLEQWSDFSSYPADVLRERIHFLLAPLPDEPELLMKVNFTENIDWPVQLLRHGRGCGMSLSKVSRALKVLPQFALRLPQVPTAVQSLDRTLAKLYEETPSTVVVMAGNQMEAWLAGASASETIALACLHYNAGWSWFCCKIFLHAFPATLQPSLDPSWDIKGRVRSQLRPEVLHYLQARLQLRPWHIQAMCRTHSTLTSYNLAMVQRNMDFLQGSLELYSDQLRQILLEMPSMFGVSTSTLQQRLDFWRFDVGLTAAHLKECALEKPAILQYNLENNLKPKLTFFRDDLNVSAEHLVELTVSQPVMWAYSLEKKLIPSAQAFVDYCGNNMTYADYGLLITKVPQLLRSNWKTNLLLKLQFLRDTLVLSDQQLCDIVNTVPWFMLQSLSTLELKISILQEQLGSDGILAVKRNPSLLLSSPNALDRRVRRCLERTTGEVTAMTLLTGTDTQKATSGGKRVYLMKKDSSEIETEFMDVAEAARYAGLSQSTMYRVLKQNLPVQGRHFAYVKPTEHVIGANEVARKNKGQSRVPSSLLEKDSQMNRLCVDVAGYAYPPGAQVRGRKRSGGMAMHIATWSTKDWRKWSDIWNGRKFRLLEDKKTLILGYHYIRPSRPRCSLYACHEALRVARLWLADTHAQSAEIEIKSDSSYVVDLLQNTTRLLEWGRVESLKECDFAGLDTVYKANPDILYAVARSFYFLFFQKDRPEVESIQVQVHFSFSLASSKNGAHARNGAKLASKLMYDATRK